METILLLYPNHIQQSLLSSYPALVNNVMRDVFTVNGDGAVPMMKKLMSSVSDVGLVTLIRDAWKGVRSL